MYFVVRGVIVSAVLCGVSECCFVSCCECECHVRVLVMAVLVVVAAADQLLNCALIIVLIFISEFPEGLAMVEESTAEGQCSFGNVIVVPVILEG